MTMTTTLEGCLRRFRTTHNNLARFKAMVKEHGMEALGDDFWLSHDGARAQANEATRDLLARLNAEAADAEINDNLTDHAEAYLDGMAAPLKGIER